MKNWVPFADGQYLVENGYFVTPQLTAVEVEKAFIEVSTLASGLRQLKGSCYVHNALFVDLHDEDDQIDLLLDLGQEFKYRLPNPVLKGGKVFTPTVKALIQFYPQQPWQQISEADYLALRDRLRLLD